MSDTGGRDFGAVVAELGLLSADEIQTLTQDAEASGQPVLSLAVQRARLSARDAEIVAALQNPLDLVPGYEILSLLGTGGMAVVYRARQQALGRTVALKTVVNHSTASQTILSRFEQEARTLASLPHPNIVSAYDLGRSGGRLYLAMEIIEGVDAERFASDRKRLSEAVTWGLIRQAASGLAFAAEQGIVHRDIKPANLLLVDPPRGYPLPAGLPLVKIADFGIALLTANLGDQTRLTGESTTVGSPVYMAPEQFASGTVDFRADIYSLGATAYHMLSGQSPFGSSTIMQVIGQKLSGGPEPLTTFRPDISISSLVLVQTMMAQAPENRPASYDDLLSRIDAVLAEISGAPSPGMTHVSPAAAVAVQSNGERLVVATAAVATDGANTAETSVMPAQDVRPGRRPFLIGAISLLALGALVTAGTMAFRETPPPPPDLVPGRWQDRLFDGESTSGWIPQSGGAVFNGPDDEGAAVLIVGPRVRASRSFNKPGAAAPLSHFDLTLVCRLAEAGTVAAEVEFGRRPRGDRLVVRLEREQILLARRLQDNQPLAEILARQDIDASERNPHEIRIQRHSEGWHVSYDDQPLGSRLVRSDESLSITIAAEGGPVWFSDLGVVELVQPAAKP